MTQMRTPHQGGFPSLFSSRINMTTGPESIRQVLADRATTLCVLVFGIAVIEWGNYSGFISPFVLPAPSAIANALVAGFRSGDFVKGIGSTIFSTIIGFALAATLAFVIGGLLVTSIRLERIFYPFIVGFQALPKIAIAPLAIIWFGLGEASKLVIVTIVCFFPILVNTIQGLRLRERERQELGIALGATRWQVFRYIRLPASLPYVFAGLRVAAVFALIGSITAEFVGSRSGLGVILIEQKAVFNVPAVYAVLVILMVIGLILNSFMTYFERRLTFWAQEKRNLGDIN